MFKIYSIIINVARSEKRRWIYILNIKLKNYTKSIVRIISIIVIAFILITAIVLLKYKPAYKVIILGEEVGYITNKKEFEKLVDNEILNPDEINVAFVDIEEMPKYEFLLIENTKQTSEEEIFTKIEEMAVTTYKIYAITLNNEVTTYVNSRDEAEEVINKMKEDRQEELEEINIAMQEVYTQNIEETKNTVEIASAMQVARNRVNKKSRRTRTNKICNTWWCIFCN